MSFVERLKRPRPTRAEIAFLLLALLALIVFVLVTLRNEDTRDRVIDQGDQITRVVRTVETIGCRTARDPSCVRLMIRLMRACGRSPACLRTHRDMVAGRLLPKPEAPMQEGIFRGIRPLTFLPEGVIVSGQRKASRLPGRH